MPVTPGLHADDDESFCVGDVDLADLDVEQIHALEARQADIATMPQADADLHSVKLLDELYGDELDVR